MRELNEQERDSYEARLTSVGFTFSAAEDTGFDITDGVVTYNYRYDDTAGTAVELMDRICAERGC